jgi:hypothetical protein
MKKKVEVKVEEPKVEVKVEEPKVEEPKVEEPKVEEPKVEEPKVLPAGNQMETLQNNLTLAYINKAGDCNYEVSSGSVQQEIKRQTRLVALIFKNFEAFNTPEKLKQFVIFLSNAKITVEKGGEKRSRSTLVDLL